MYSTGRVAPDHIQVWVEQTDGLPMKGESLLMSHISSSMNSMLPSNTEYTQDLATLVSAIPSNAVALRGERLSA